MSFIWFQSALLLLSQSIAASGLNLHCGTESIWIMDTQCVARNVEVFDENEHLHFDYKDKPLIHVDTLEIHIKEKNIGFTVIPREIFTIFPKLKVLWIMKSNMDDLSSDHIKSGKKLEALGLRECKITEVKPNTFSGFKRMKFLALESNHLTFIHRDTFATLTNLTTLKLNKNQIKRIDDGAFNLPKLIRLDLSRNKLTNISESIFSSLPRLESLYLSFNELTHVGSSLFGLPQIVNIGLDNNKIVDIDLAKFATMSALYWLNLNNTGFSFDSQKLSAVENESFKKLILADNNLTNAQDLNKLSLFKGLEVLDLSGNSEIALLLPSINIKSFLPKLEYVKLLRSNIDCEKSRMLEHQLGEQGVTFLYDLWCKSARTCAFNFLC